MTHHEDTRRVPRYSAPPIPSDRRVEPQVGRIVFSPETPHGKYQSALGTTEAELVFPDHPASPVHAASFGIDLAGMMTRTDRLGEAVMRLFPEMRDVTVEMPNSASDEDVDTFIALLEMSAPMLHGMEFDVEFPVAQKLTGSNDWLATKLAEQDQKLFDDIDTTAGIMRRRDALVAKKAEEAYGHIPLFWAAKAFYSQANDRDYTTSAEFASDFMKLFEEKQFERGPRCPDNAIGALVSTSEEHQRWLLLALRLVVNLPNVEFTNDDLYRAAGEWNVSNEYPNNHNVEAKLRQCMQHFVTANLIERIEPGHYKKAWREVAAVTESVGDISNTKVFAPAADRQTVLISEQEAEYRRTIAALTDAVIWMSGSGDFSPDEEAGKVFQTRVRPALDAANKVMRGECKFDEHLLNVIARLSKRLDATRDSLQDTVESLEPDALHG